MYYNFFFFWKYDVYEIMSKKNGRARLATDDKIIRGMRIAYLINKTTNTQSEY
jgi:hypothetical protein